MGDRAILHSDMNCFYAAVEMLHHPEHEGKPLAVGGDPEARHGIILTANYIAKKCGVKVGMALWQAKQVCHDLIIVHPRMDLYLRFSRLAQQIYSEYTDLLEPFGIDESWLDVSASVSAKGDPLSIAEEISQKVRHELGLTVSVGVSWNKIYSKFGSDYKKPDAITEISRDNYRNIVWSAPVSDLLYVGRANTKKLKKLGFHTIGDIARCDPELLRLQFGKIGLILWVFARGEDTTPVAAMDYESPIKSIGNSTTTPRDLVDENDVRMVVYLLAESVAARLRENHFVGRNVGISVRDNGLFSFCRQRQIQIPTNISDEIAGYAMRMFREHYRWEAPIRSLGIRVSDLKPDTFCYQLDLFTDERKREKQLKADLAVNELRRRFGHDSVLRCRMYYDRVLAGLDAKAEEHMVHPHGFFEKGNKVELQEAT